MANRAIRCQDLADKMRVKMLDMAEYGNDSMHWGGSFSCAEIFSVLYSEILNVKDRTIRFEKKISFCYRKAMRRWGCMR